MSFPLLFRRAATGLFIAATLGLAACSYSSKTVAEMPSDGTPSTATAITGFSE